MDQSSRRVEKRNRPPVSCEFCRRRKLKCNRESPCDSCMKRSRSSECYYADANRRSAPAPAKKRDLKDRLQSLENAVTNIISHATVDPASSSVVFPSTSDGTAALTPETPRLHEAEHGQLNYLDPGHWLSILDDIKEVRTALESPSKDVAIDHGSVEPDASFLFAPKTSTGIRDILASLPPQSRCDMLLSYYFNSNFMVLAIVHPERFRMEYEAFWESSTSVSPLWLALLLSILTMSAALRALFHKEEAADLHQSLRIWRPKITECLMLGRYATANAYALEAFLLHLQSQLLAREGSPVNAWFEMGTIIRLAFRMGYHRDPDNLPGISVFDGEMRRRVWLNITQLEALMSFMLGFPTMIPMESCDARDPRNLHYTDLQSEMTELPPERPFIEHTPVLYIIVKSRIMRIFKLINAYTQSFTPPTYHRTMELDAEMRRTYAQLPEKFKRRDIARSFMDPTDLIIQRTTIEILYLKALIVLHRRYVTEGFRNPAFELSQRACVEAALDVLARQEDLHRAYQPGGRLQNDVSIFLALPTSDFLLAAMVITLDISVQMRSDNYPSMEVHADQDLNRREVAALHGARSFWADSPSRDLQLATRAIDVMIKKLGQAESERKVFSQESHAPQNNRVVDTNPPLDPLSASNEGPLAPMIDGLDDVDWSVLDQYFMNLDDLVEDPNGEGFGFTNPDDD